MEQIGHYLLYGTQKKWDSFSFSFSFFWDSFSWWIISFSNFWRRKKNDPVPSFIIQIQKAELSVLQTKLRWTQLEITE